ncbi:MAG: phage N-6-adenine-methyltransferase, partial [Acidobacteriales bacterium]|nr:phage N-6-adenine-methyltransferase [Terriglobales bacterium]
YRLIEAAEVYENVSNWTQTLPATESQARPLTALPPEQQAPAWQQAVDSAPAGRVTAAHVQTVVETLHRQTPHVARNSGVSEWYTPPHIIQAAVNTMGHIDLDPASTDIAQGIIGAQSYYTTEEDGLAQPWHGNVWLNPPYAQPLISQFADKFAAEYEAGNITHACILVNNATETAWFRAFLKVAAAICLLDGRVRFLDPNGRPGAPLQGQIVLYVGRDTALFTEHFSELGPVLYVRPTR